MNGRPTPDAEDEVTVEDGALHLEHYDPPSASAGVVVFVHGFDAHCGLYRHVGARLAACGFTATLFDGRGHGKSSGRRGHIDRFEQYETDLQAVLSVARARVPGVPVTAMGHSQGGLVVLDAVVRGALTPAPDRLVLVAPWLGLAIPVPWWKRYASPLMARVWPTLTMDNGLRAEDISRDPSLPRRRREDPLFHHRASARWFEEVQRTQRHLRVSAPSLGIPALVLVAGQDRIVSNETTLAVVRAAGPAITLRRYENAYHELFIEPEQDEVLTDIVTWLRAPAATGLELTRAPLEVPSII